MALIQDGYIERFHYTTAETTGAIEAYKRAGVIRPVDGRLGYYERTAC
jgi:hypothetical protein